MAMRVTFMPVFPIVPYVNLGADCGARPWAAAAWAGEPDSEGTEAEASAGSARLPKKVRRDDEFIGTSPFENRKIGP
jgi:hypothetical protein